MTLEWFEQAPQINRVRDYEVAHIQAYPGAHHLEGAPTCRIQEPTRAASRGIPSRESFCALVP
jgi:hypothetical protein